jgi:hypothetical protein
MNSVLKPHDRNEFTKMRDVDPSLTHPHLSSLADFTHCIFRSLTSARCCNYSYMCS